MAHHDEGVAHCNEGVASCEGVTHLLERCIIYNYKHIPGQVPSEMGNSVPKGLQDEDDVIIIDDALKTAVSYIPATLYCLQTCNILKLLY